MERSLHLFSLTLLILVLMLLLLGFVGTPISCLRAVPVNLPASTGETLLPESTLDLEIRITADRKFFVGPNAVPADKVQHELTELAQRTSSDRRIVVHADASLPYSVIEDVLAASRSAGFTDISLVTFQGTHLQAWQLR